MTRTTTARRRMLGGTMTCLVLAGLLTTTACGGSGGVVAAPDAGAGPRVTPTTADPEPAPPASPRASEEPSRPPATPPTVTAEATTTATVTARVSPAAAPATPDDVTAGLDDLPPGTHHAFLTGLAQEDVAGRRTTVLALDKADLLTGPEAVAAAREAGVIGPDEESVPNDAFVSDVNPLVRRLAVVDGLPVRLLVGNTSELHEGDIQAAVGAGGLFELTVDDVDGLSRVTSVTAVYLP